MKEADVAPAGTPRDVVNGVIAAIGGVLTHDIRERLIDLGFHPIGATFEPFAAIIKSETEKSARVVKAAGVRLN